MKQGGIMKAFSVQRHGGEGRRPGDLWWEPPSAPFKRLRFLRFRVFLERGEDELKGVIIKIYIIPSHEA